MSTGPTIPQPPMKPIIGNLTELDADAPVQGLMALARIYGPYFKLQVFDRTVHVASSQALVNELCDESRFNKRVHPPLEEIRAFAKDGLFTAYSEEPNWAKAHRILMPAFGPIGVRSMFDQMLDIAVEHGRAFSDIRASAELRPLLVEQVSMYLSDQQSLADTQMFLKEEYDAILEDNGFL